MPTPHPYSLQGRSPLGSPFPPPIRKLLTSWSSPRDWSLLVKLTIVLLVPGVLAVVLGGLRIADQAGRAVDLDRVSRFAAAQGEVETLLHRLQTERLRATAFVANGRRDDPKSLDAVFAGVAASGTATGPTVQALYPDDPALVGVDQATRQGLNRLDSLRALATTSNAPASAIVSRYTDLINQVSQLDDQLLRGVNTTVTNGLTTALSGLAVARNEASLQEALINAAIRDVSPARPALVDVTASNARLAAGLADFRAALDVGQRVRYAGLIAGASNTNRSMLVNGLLAQNGNRPLDPGSAGNFEQVYQAFLADIDGTENGVRSELTSGTSDSRAAAITQAVLNTVLVVLALLIGAVVVGLIARALLTALRVLRSSALDVARNRLPAALRQMRSGAIPDANVSPVPITTNEEIGEVARAFDAVHTEAVGLAAEQARLQKSVNRMFINLSRRSKSLVDKQLQLIEGMERDEQNADQLSSLFRLDHLATRMRRNSDNLLVLAGSELPAWSSQPVPVVDVMRAAISEIERYERIVVDPPPPVVLAGRAANDLQHLFAELLDNATSFSPPDSQVVMSAHYNSAGAIVVEIADRGVGMTAEELAEANAQLNRAVAASAETGRRMGLQVVGRLAARLDVRVELLSGLGHGVTARVAIPQNLVSQPVNIPDQARRVPSPRPPASPPTQGPAGLPRRSPGSPTHPAPRADNAELFAAGDENQDEPATVRRPSPARADAAEREPVEAAWGPAFALPDPENGQARHYRPININWAPNPRNGAASNGRDEPGDARH